MVIQSIPQDPVPAKFLMPAGSAQVQTTDESEHSRSMHGVHSPVCRVNGEKMKFAVRARSAREAAPYAGGTRRRRHDFTEESTGTETKGKSCGCGFRMLVFDVYLNKYGSLFGRTKVRTGGKEMTYAAEYKIDHTGPSI